MSSISFIVNPVSGTGNAKKIPTLIETFFQNAKQPYSIRYTEYAGHAKLIVAEELQKGTAIIVAVGGDGTVNEIGAALLHTKGVLGIIPTGSGNGLARHLNIPMNPIQALNTITSGQIITIDSGELNGKAFFCTAGIGFDAVVAKRFSLLAGRGLLNYIIASLKEYRAFSPEKITDQKQNEYTGFLLSICNANQYGNNAYICPNAQINDGQLNLVEVAKLSFSDIPTFVVNLFSKKLSEGKNYKNIPFSKITLTRTSKGPVHIDGDPIEDTDSIEVRCVRDSLSVVVPNK